MTSTKFRRRFGTAAAVAVIAGSLSAVNAVGSPHSDHGPDAVSGTISSTAADAEYLLGEGLLGLDPAVVDDLAADQAFAESVSADLRSGDPYVIDDALSAIADRVDIEPTDPEAAMVGANSYVIAWYEFAVIMKYSPFPERPRGVDIVTSPGLDREQAVSHIVETLGRS